MIKRQLQKRRGSSMRMFKDKTLAWANTAALKAATGASGMPGDTRRIAGGDDDASGPAALVQFYFRELDFDRHLAAKLLRKLKKHGLPTEADLREEIRRCNGAQDLACLEVAILAKLHDKHRSACLAHIYQPLLRSNELFHHLIRAVPEEELLAFEQRLLHGFARDHLACNRYLNVSPRGAIYVVRRGAVRVFQKGTIVATLERGAVFEICALSDEYVTIHYSKDLPVLHQGGGGGGGGASAIDHLALDTASCVAAGDRRSSESKSADLSPYGSVVEEIDEEDEDASLPGAEDEGGVGHAVADGMARRGLPRPAAQQPIYICERLHDETGAGTSGATRAESQGLLARVGSSLSIDSGSSAASLARKPPRPAALGRPAGSEAEHSGLCGSPVPPPRDTPGSTSELLAPGSISELLAPAPLSPSGSEATLHHDEHTSSGDRETDFGGSPRSSVFPTGSPLRPNQARARPATNLADLDLDYDLDGVALSEPEDLGSRSARDRCAIRRAGHSSTIPETNTGAGTGASMFPDGPSNQELDEPIRATLSTASASSSPVASSSTGPTPNFGGMLNARGYNRHSFGGSSSPKSNPLLNKSRRRRSLANAFGLLGNRRRSSAEDRRPPLCMQAGRDVPLFLWNTVSICAVDRDPAANAMLFDPSSSERATATYPYGAELGVMPSDSFRAIVADFPSVQRNLDVVSVSIEMQVEKEAAALRRKQEAARRRLELEHARAVNRELEQACRDGHLERAREAVSAGADVTSPLDASGATALHLAALFGHVEVVNLLLRLGADSRARDNEGRTPLHLCCLVGNWTQPVAGKIVNYLVQHDTCLVQRDMWENTPLHLAASVGDAAMLQTLMIAVSRFASDTTPITPPDLEDVSVPAFPPGSVLAMRNHDGLTPLELCHGLDSRRILKPKTHYGADMR